MKRYLLTSVIATVFLCAGHAGAKEVNLGMGKSFRQGDLTVTCCQFSNDTPLNSQRMPVLGLFKKKDASLKKQRISIKISNALKIVSTGKSVQHHL